jgi:F-box interacting protein
MGTGKTTASGYVVDDDSSGWRGIKLWTSDEDVHVVGTCNGLICFCNDGKLGGRVSLLNPITEEQLVVPPLPARYHYSSGSGQGQPAPSVRRWHEAYSFGYHPITGRYKIVHVDLASEPIAVQVFTLGEASWRGVPLPAAVGAIGNLGSGGLVSVDGTTYWLGKDGSGGKVVSLELGDERLHASPLPVTTKPGVALTVVHGRLGVALDRNGKTDVWVLEGRRWSRRYEVQLDGRQRLTSPRFAHGKYVLTEKEVTERWRQGSDIYGHRLTEKRSLLLCNVSRSREPAVRGVQGSIDRAFAYVPTMEPLSVYASRL